MCLGQDKPCIHEPVIAEHFEETQEEFEARVDRILREIEADRIK